MASVISALTSGGGGISMTGDASGILNLNSNGTNVVAVTATGASVTGTLAATGGITATGLTSKIQPITASVAASALTVTLNPTILDFRASPLTSGTVTTIAVPAAISVTIPSTSTMGTVSAVQSRIVVIAINNAGTVELAAVNISGGSVLDETTLITTTAAVAAGNSATAYYSTTARTSVAYRVVGYVESTQATAGTWATAPSTLQGAGGNAVALPIGSMNNILHFRDERASGTDAGSSSVGNQVRTLNTVVSNTILGASLATNQITLPAGTYQINANAPTVAGAQHRLRLVNVTDSTVVLLGTSMYDANAAVVSTRSFVIGVFTLNATKVLNLTHYIAQAKATDGLGISTSDTFVNVYAMALITRIG